MPKPKADPELVAQARELVAMGASLREAARTLGVSAPTIKRWLEEAPASAPPPASAALPAHMKPPEVPAITPLDTSDPRKMVEQLIGDIYSMIQHNRASGDTRQMGSLAATVSKLSVTMRQLNEAAQSAADGITVSAAEVARIEASLAERIKAICNRPLLCSECSRELSVFWGTGLTEAALNADDPDPNGAAKPA
jgi:transposase-like protein